MVLGKNAVERHPVRRPNERLSSKVNDYLESVREIERPLQKTAGSVSADLKLPEIPAGIPENFEERINLMFDMAALAYQANCAARLAILPTAKSACRTRSIRPRINHRTSLNPPPPRGRLGAGVVLRYGQEISKAA